MLTKCETIEIKQQIPCHGLSKALLESVEKINF